MLNRYATTMASIFKKTPVFDCNFNGFVKALEHHNFPSDYLESGKWEAKSA